MIQKLFDTPITMENVPTWFVDNGCGPSKFGGKAIPELGFSPACRKHDYLYWTGGDESDRKFADDEFRRDMVSLVPWWRILTPFIYWRAVRRFGGFAFTYRPKRLTVEEAEELWHQQHPRA